MYVIQRVKRAPGVSGATNTHYAAAIAGAGNVTEWTTDRAKAVVVGEDVALKIEDWYAALAAKGQPVGEVKAVDVVPVAPPVTKTVTDDAE